ncbi:hypothetical protein [Candidatus Lokiarchaeum ossiferum]|uniref:hypothetical protein n=1 Tax=Candidatus Lokiarchaeum ossiferum TaxID=2951803 RepID=UPI00352E73F3
MESKKNLNNLAEIDSIYIKNLDIFRELGNICAGGAGNILSKLIKKKIYFDIPPAKYLSISQIIKGRLIENKNQICLYGTIEGFFQGKIFLMMPIDESGIIIESLNKLNRLEKKEDDKIENSNDIILQEFFRKLIIAYTEALGSFLQKTLIFEEYQFLMNLGSDFESYLVKSTKVNQKKAITVETIIKVENEEIIHCSFLLILSTNEIDKILKRINEVW